MIVDPAESFVLVPLELKGMVWGFRRLTCMTGRHSGMERLGIDCPGNRGLLKDLEGRSLENGG